MPEPPSSRDDGVDPEQEAVLADSVGLALLVVLETLTPAERLAFVLHDMFAVPFDEIAPIVGRSPAAARQLASRARRRVQGAGAVPDADRARQREVVDAFLAASRAGDFDALLALLDPDVVLRADRTAVEFGADEEVIGSPAVAETFSGRARARAARAHRRRRRSRVVAGRNTARRLRPHDRRRPDRRDRARSPTRRGLASARSRDPHRLSARPHCRGRCWCCKGVNLRFDPCIARSPSPRPTR